jgi:cation:H+ antiporter
MILSIILLVLGFVFVVKGADWLVEGAAALAKKYHISDLAIGLTIVAFGTSAPELAVNIFASVQNHPEIVLGNIIGSNNFNLFIILGIAGLIAPMTVQSSTIWKEIPLSLLAAILVLFLSGGIMPGQNLLLSRFDGLLLLIMFGIFLYYIYKSMIKDRDIPEIKTKSLPLWKIIIFIILGLTLLIIGGKLVEIYAVKIATELGVSEAIIGLTIVAAGTSLPELATSLVAAFKKNNDIAIGNVVGSNIFNIFFILGLSAVINPVKYSIKFNSDIIILCIGTILLFFAMFTGKKKKLDRWEALILLLIYVGYTIFLINNEIK